MAKNSPSKAKNQMRRSLQAILDPHPTREGLAELWRFFESKCAYCGLVLDKVSRAGHVDHVVSYSSGGTNCIFNHVLSCGRCNGDEKREEHWESFLRRKIENSVQYEARRLRIEEWLARSPKRHKSNASQAEADAIIQTALESFDNAVKQMRALRETGN
jgi:5-methylcytosine-specific restriction endonuclease McrA